MFWERDFFHNSAVLFISQIELYPAFAWFAPSEWDPRCRWWPALFLLLCFFGKDRGQRPGRERKEELRHQEPAQPFFHPSAR